MYYCIISSILSVKITYHYMVPIQQLFTALTFYVYQIAY